MTERIYLDNAATSWPKPESVYAAVDDAMRRLGAAAGRSAYAEAGEVERLVTDTRRRVARLIGSSQAKQIVFTSNGTDSLNLAIHGTLREGDHVITTVVEHNSVLRPLRHLEQLGKIKVTRVDCRDDGVVDPAMVREAITDQTRLIAVTHASNVTGAIQPIKEIGEFCKDTQIVFLVDAAQSMGHLELRVQQNNVDLLAAPTHKGLLGPLGCGILYIGERVQEHVLPLRQGGTGTQSEDDHQPESMPDRYESGNHNVPGILGLHASLEFIDQQSLVALRAHEQELTRKLLNELANVSGITVFGPQQATLRVGVISLRVEGYDSREVAAMLETSHRIQTRAGFHCAPLMHARMGTLDGGTVRLSVGPFTTSDQIEVTLVALREIAASAIN